jgi:acyl-CoA synthetase (AMP-forming)/AMP-acid ligase II
MQSFGLTVDKFLDHAAKWFGDHEVVWAEKGVPVARLGYADLRERANRLSGALVALGVQPGDRIGTLAWNTRDHLEVYYGVMGIGGVCHTLNPRLTSAQLAAMIDEADDRILAVATDLMPLIAQVLPHCPGIRHVIELDGDEANPATTGATWSKQALIAAHGRSVTWGEFDENAPAGLCYTSGTTGRPKGVLYTHRSNYLHTLRALQADVVGLTARDVLLLAVPMFHANGWGLPFAAPAAGTKMVLPGRHLDGASLAQIIRAERATVAVGVQTVWLGLVDHLDRTGEDLPSLERVIIGGSNCPDALLDRLQTRLGARVQTSWGMTELSPIGTMSPATAAPGPSGSAGPPPLGLDLKLTGANGATLPEQRGVQGHLKVRGASVLDRYFDANTEALDDEGYFDTGDLAIIDTAGNLTICGRAKDLIKSGGEWINPAEIEAIIGAHASVRHVAVIARPDPRWGERPLLVVEGEPTDDARKLLDLLRGKVADWWIPDRVAVVGTMPLASTGKIDKTRLRADYEQGLIIAEQV